MIKFNIMIDNGGMFIHAGVGILLLWHLPDIFDYFNSGKYSI